MLAMPSRECQGRHLGRRRGNTGRPHARNETASFDAGRDGCVDLDRHRGLQFLVEDRLELDDTDVHGREFGDADNVGRDADNLLHRQQFQQLL
jgi:hypothetical protein